MNFMERFATAPMIVTEASILERINREYALPTNEYIANSGWVRIPEYRKVMEDIYRQYIDIAQEFNLPMIICAPIRRATPERINKTEYKGIDLVEENVQMMRNLAKGRTNPIYIACVIGCRGDAYKANDQKMGVDEAQEYHSVQMQIVARQQPDLIYETMMPEKEEMIGLAKAMDAYDFPYIVNPMMRNTGRMLDGTTMHEAIEAVDAATTRKPSFYMANCIHPKNLYAALDQPFNQTELVKNRFFGIIGNASPMTPEELESGKPIYNSSPEEWVEEMIKLHNRFHLKVYGCCCGTDERYMRLMVERMTPLMK